MTQSQSSEGILIKQLKQAIDDKKDLRDPLIEILREAQEIFGYLPTDVLQIIAEDLRLPISEIYGVVTFYNFFSMKPQGKFVFNVCTGTACYVKGAPRLIQMLEDELGIKAGETTEDGLFTISTVRCVGACSLAPVFVIGEETFARIENREKLLEIINNYKRLV
ncbi:NAD(P)H-dependent oxidoreductase subunit E [Candidatus Cloacimonadota bacterium]